jgi:hypothetical protein
VLRGEDEAESRLAYRMSGPGAVRGRREDDGEKQGSTRGARLCAAERCADPSAQRQESGAAARHVLGHVQPCARQEAPPCPLRSHVATAAQLPHPQAIIDVVAVQHISISSRSRYGRSRLSSLGAASPSARKGEPWPRARACRAGCRGAPLRPRAAALRGAAWRGAAP